MEVYQPLKKAKTNVWSFVCRFLQPCKESRRPQAHPIRRAFVLIHNVLTLRWHITHSTKETQPAIKHLSHPFRASPHILPYPADSIRASSSFLRILLYPAPTIRIQSSLTQLSNARSFRVGLRLFLVRKINFFLRAHQKGRKGRKEIGPLESTRRTCARKQCGRLKWILESCSFGRNRRILWAGSKCTKRQKNL